MNKQTEKRIETLILDFLNFLPGCFAWKNNNVGIYDQAKGKYRKPKGKHHYNGIPDILGIYKGRMLAIEVKTKSGKTSDEQSKFLHRIIREGGIAGVARSVDDAREIIKDFGGDNDTTKELSKRLRERDIQVL